jgi:hypothetical protein
LPFAIDCPRSSIASWRPKSIEEGRHVVNRAHRRTISAAPKRCPSRGAIPTLDVAQGLFGEPCQIHLRPHTTSMSAIIAAFVSGLERRRWGRHRRHHSRSL